MSEPCLRCGESGSDRRTLWMACFYAMDELGVPFDQLQIRGTVAEKVGEKSVLGHPCPVYAEHKGEAADRSFFTLRVCKRCRGEWMAAIKEWFLARPKGQDIDADEPPPISSGIFVRENGATVEISREEWDRRNPSREPVTVQPRCETCGWPLYENINDGCVAGNCCQRR